MFILFVSRGWPSEREPQWGNFEIDQAQSLRRLGHRVVVLSVDSRFRKYSRKFGITKTMHDDIPHYDLFAGSFWGRPLRKISMWAQSRAKQRLALYLFKKVVEQEGMPDLVYGHYLGGCYMALAIKRKYGVPAIGIEHWSELGFDEIKKPIKKLAARTYPYLDRQLVVSSSLRENVKKAIGIDTIVVNNMVGREFQYVPNAKVGQTVRFVTTGNLLPVKGFDNLINAFGQLNLPLDSWSLRILGGGSEQDHLQKQIDDLCLGDNIQLCGRKNRNGVIEALQNSDVYVMSSRSETFGVAAIEALACGLPVVATDCGGARDFLTKENGIICPVNDVDGLAEALLQMYRTYKDFDRAQIAADCQSHFSSEAIGKQLEGIFKEVVSQNS